MLGKIVRGVTNTVFGGGKGGGGGFGGALSKVASKIMDKKAKSKSSGGAIRKAMKKVRKTPDSPVRQAMEGAEGLKRKRKGYGLAGGSDK